MSEPTARHRLLRLASTLPKGSEERAEVLSVLAKKDLPEELKKHQFTEEDNPNPKGNDKDGDGETGEASPVPKKEAGCDSPKLPDALKEQCKKKEEAKESGDKDSDKKAESQGRAASEATLRKGLIRMAFEMPKGSDERRKILEVLQG
jgi:hypothetical protein